MENKVGIKRVEHYITQIHVHQVRHLENLDIALHTGRRSHLILTGKNGSGKTSLIHALRDNLSALLSRGKDLTLKNNSETTEYATAGVTIALHGDLARDYITACYLADRRLQLSVPHGVENVKLADAYSVEQHPVSELLEYMVHLKTQQSFAKNEGDDGVAGRIANWFTQLERAMQRLLDDKSLTVEYDYKNYNFVLHQVGRLPYDFTQLSDGFSAALYILADLLMRMDHNWLLQDREMNRDIEGIVLIDELETHLHLDLQKRILPFLIDMFPKLQFIVTTHSPFVVSSLEHAVIYDLENRTLIRQGLSNVTYEGVIEGFFHVETLSNVFQEKLARYEYLVQKSSRTDDEYDEIMSLEQDLDTIPTYLSAGLAEKYGRLKLEYQVKEDTK